MQVKNMKPNIRPATIEDLPQLESVEQKLIEFERACDPQIRSGDDVRYYDLPNVINHPETSVIFVAEVDSDIIGCGMGTIKTLENWAKGDQFGMINMIYTEEAHRGQNVASEILNTLRDWFAEKNITDIRLKVYSNNEGAIKAYEKNGFTPFVHEMKLKN